MIVYNSVFHRVIANERFWGGYKWTVCGTHQPIHYLQYLHDNRHKKLKSTLILRKYWTLVHMFQYERCEMIVCHQKVHPCCRMAKYSA